MKSIKLFLLLMLFMLDSCVFFDMPKHVFQDLRFVNNSDSDVSFYPYSFSFAILKYEMFYPDTLLPPLDTGYVSMDDFHKVLPMKSYTFHSLLEQTHLKKIPNRKDSLLMFYVFSVDTLEKYSWEEIREGYMVLKRYDLSITDLDSLNWTITYP